MKVEQTALQTMWQVFFEPNKAFASVQQRGGFLLPLLLLLISTIVVSYVYARGVDFGWLADHLTSEVMTGQSRERIEAFRTHFTHDSFVRDSLITATAVTLGLLILLSTYLAIVSAALGATHSFTRWFAFTCWANMPALLTNLGILITVSMDHSGQLPPATLDPQGLNSFLQLGMNHAWFKLVSLISLPQIWVWVAMTIGFSLWSKRSLGLSAAIVVLPYLLYALIF
jgi:hypothetical protein